MDDKKTEKNNINDEILDLFDGSDKTFTREIASEKLKEVSKKLPKWSLDPPPKFKE